MPVASQVLVSLQPKSFEIVEILVQNQLDYETRNISQIAPVPIIRSKVDKVRLTNDQIEQFDIRAKQLTIDSIEETIVAMRGGDQLTDIATFIGFILFMNWLDSLSGAFQANPFPHRDPLGWLQGS